MTTFTNGPANGKTLMLKRIPYFLRVVQDGDKFDALDQPNDKPSPGETIHVYRHVETRGHVSISRRGGGGGFYPIASFEFHSTPQDSEVREVAEWIAWCVANKPADLSTDH